MAWSVKRTREFLLRQFGDVIDRVEPLRGGHWSEAYAFEADYEPRVIRFGKHVEDFLKDRAASQFSSADLPIPQVLEIGYAGEDHYCISERAFGGMLDELDGADMQRIVPALLRALDALRSVNANLLLGKQTMTWADQLLLVDEETDRVNGWHDRMADSPTGSSPYEKGLAYLQERASSLPNADHIVHNDLLHFNVLVANDSSTGVIDWGNAMRGDFLYDLAMFTFYSPWYPAMAGIDWLESAKQHYSTIGLTVPDLEERMQCYEVHLGIAGMAYASFRSNWPEFEANALRTLGRMSS
jgi:hygromycin-B 4-O-kinase